MSRNMPSSSSLSTRTRGEAEAAFTKAMIALEKEHFGRGPLDARSFFIQDMVLVRLMGVLTPAEAKLAASREGQELVKETRRQLFEITRPLVEELVVVELGCNLISLHTDMSTKTGERIVVLTVDTNLEKRYPARSR